MINYKIGCNFDFKLLEGLKEILPKYTDCKVSELYGSDRRSSFLTARPDFRLPNIDKDHFEKYIKEVNDMGLEFNYTMNTIYPGSKNELNLKIQEIKDYIKYLEDIGIKRLTISNPILLDIVRSCSDIEIEISTIAHIDTISQIKYYKEKYNVDKVCGNLLKNRSIKFLKNAALYCNDNNIKYELMVNEFCGVGGFEYVTHCIYRDSCYLCHAQNVMKEDDLLLNHYPMKYCMSSRNNYPPNWLRVRFIRPEDIDKYAELGITNFKITGRTGSTEYILKIVESYLKKEYNENLLGLWKPLETITTNQNENDFDHKINIPNKLLKDYVNMWFENENFDCANENCGVTCRYCHDFYKENVKPFINNEYEGN